MTRKEFNQRIDVHVYGNKRDSKIIAVFFDWCEGINQYGQKYSLGYKYCVFARATIATQKDLENAMYKFAIKHEYISEYYIQTIMAETDEQRFKVPICSSGLNCLIKRFAVV